MNFGVKNYWKPTPKLLRAIGDSLLTAGSTATAMAIFSEKIGLALFILAITIAGKFLTNFFAE